MNSSVDYVWNRRRAVVVFSWGAKIVFAVCRGPKERDYRSHWKTSFVNLVEQGVLVSLRCYLLYFAFVLCGVTLTTRIDKSSFYSLLSTLRITSAMIMETPVTTNENSFSGQLPPGRIYFTIKYYCTMYFCIHLYSLFFTKKQIEKEATVPTLGISRGYALISYVQQILSQIEVDFNMEAVTNNFLLREVLIALQAPRSGLL